MTTKTGRDGQTYILSSTGFTNTVTNDSNYYGGTNTNGGFYTFTSVTNFTNTRIIIAYPGVHSSRTGGHAINNASNGITIKNYGYLLGGGGAGGNNFGGTNTAAGGYGGGGGGGGSSSSIDAGGSGGSILNANSNGGQGYSRFPLEYSSGGGGGASYGGIGGVKSDTIPRANSNSAGGNGGTISNYIGSNSIRDGESLYGGGGGAFGGNGSGGSYSGGGGGSGGGRPGGGGGPGGGGYSIYNTGTITSLYNSQGVNTYYGPLFYGGTSLPTNYYIRINSNTEYGQLFCTGWGEILSGTFNNIYIDPLSSISLTETILSSVLVGNCFAVKDWTNVVINAKTVSYRITLASSQVTVGATSYSAYDLTTKIIPIPNAPGAQNTSFFLITNNSGIQADFYVAVDNGSPIIRYEYALTRTDNSTTTDWITVSPLIGPTPNNGNPYYTTNIYPSIYGPTYEVKIRAVNAAGNGAENYFTDGNGNRKSLTPYTVPGAPTGLSLSPGNTQITLSFTAPTSNGGRAIDHYEYSTDGTTYLSTGSTNLSHIITGLTNGLTYTVYLRANNVSGIGTNSGASTSASVSLNLIQTFSIIPTKNYYFYNGNNLDTILKLNPSFNTTTTTNYKMNNVDIGKRYITSGERPAIITNYNISGADLNTLFVITAITNAPLPVDRLSILTKNAILPDSTTAITSIPSSGPLTSVSGAKSAGVYGCKLLFSSYTGPVMTIRRSASSNSHFFADSNGNLGSEYLGTGISLFTWLNGAIPYVQIWWDQTGNGNHAYQFTLVNQPIYDPVNKYIIFPRTTFFNLPNGAHPYNDSQYTYVFKCSITYEVGTIFAGGGYYTQNGSNGFRRDSDYGYRNYWFNKDVTAKSNIYSDNSVISLVYDGYMTYMYKNGVSVPLIPREVSQTGRQQTEFYNTIGKASLVDDQHMGGGYIEYMYIIPQAISNLDRDILESTNPQEILLRQALIWLDAADFTTLFQYADSTGQITDTGQSVRSWKNKGTSTTTPNIIWSSSNGITFTYITSNPNSIPYPSLRFNSSISVMNPDNNPNVVSIKNTTTSITADVTSIFYVVSFAYETRSNYITYSGLLGSPNMPAKEGTPASHINHLYGFFDPPPPPSTNTNTGNNIVGQSSLGTIYINGNATTRVSDINKLAIVAAVSTSTTRLTQAIIGVGDEGAYLWKGYICEILMFNIVLTTGQRQIIEGYLAQKWGLASSLPTGHPYKS